MLMGDIRVMSINIYNDELLKLNTTYKDTTYINKYYLNLLLESRLKYVHILNIQFYEENPTGTVSTTTG